MSKQGAHADGGGFTHGWSGEDPDGGVSPVPSRDDGVSLFEYDPSVLDPSSAVVQAVATHLDRSSVEIAPLFSAVDPEALDAVFAGTGVREVSFTYEGYSVTIDGDARISLRSVDPA